MATVSFEEATYKGRQICESQGGGYCGSIPFDGHCEQLNDDDSWVHSSKETWLRAYAISLNQSQIEQINNKAKDQVEALIEDCINSILLK